MFGIFSKDKQPASALTIPITITAKVLFHKDVNGRVEHGTLYAEHPTLSVKKDDGLRFAFADIDPPLMTPEVMAHIWDQAERQGYVVHSLRSYATVFTLQPTPRVNVFPSKDGQPARTGVSRQMRRAPDARTGGPQSRDR
jgi:hypothetical protein